MTEPTDAEVEAMVVAMFKDLEKQGRDENRPNHLVCHVKTLGGEQGDFAVVCGAINVHRLAKAASRARVALQREENGDEVRG